MSSSESSPPSKREKKIITKIIICWLRRYWKSAPPTTPIKRTTKAGRKREKSKKKSPGLSRFETTNPMLMKAIRPSKACHLKILHLSFPVSGKSQRAMWKILTAWIP
jgi:hypothetical protein